MSEENQRQERKYWSWPHRFQFFQSPWERKHSESSVCEKITAHGESRSSLKPKLQITEA